MVRKRASRSRLGWAAAALLALALAGCTDHGQEHYAKARAEYESLLLKSKRPTDPAFDPVIHELEQVKPDSAAYPKAQQILGAIERARAAPMPPVPLVEHPPTTPEPEAVAAQRQRCIALSQKLGEAVDPKGRAETQHALALCRDELAKALERAHPDHP